MGMNDQFGAWVAGPGTVIAMDGVKQAHLLLGDRTTIDVAAGFEHRDGGPERRLVLVVPIGSCEQHGPHLPLATDSIIAEALAAELAARLTAFGPPAVGDVLVAPTISVTASGEHAGFPGTLSIGTDVMRAVVVELVRSASWAAGVVLVNGHGGNHDAVTGAVRQLVAEGHRVLSWWPVIDDPSAASDLHAGHLETSLLLWLAPEHVRAERAVAGPSPSIADLRDRGVKELSPSGVLGDPTAADGRAGEAIFAGLADSLTATTLDWYGAT